MRPAAIWSVAAVLAIAGTGSTYYWYVNHHAVDFESAAWKAVGPAKLDYGRRYPMARHLVSSQQLLGRTRADIEQSLGPASRLAHVEVAEALTEASKVPRAPGPWDDAMGYPVRCSNTYYLPICSELGIRFGNTGRVVEARVFDR